MASELAKEEMRKIRERRKGIPGLTQERFAALVGVHRVHYVNLENGKHTPSSDLFLRMQRTLERLEGEESAKKLKGAA